MDLVYFFEGVDCAGKSSTLEVVQRELEEAIAKTYFEGFKKVSVIRVNLPSPEVRKQMRKTDDNQLKVLLNLMEMRKIAAKKDKSFSNSHLRIYLFDRSWLSTAVYNSSSRTQQHLLTEFGMELLAPIFPSRVFFFDAHTTKIVSRMQNEPEEERLTVQRIKEIKRGYTELLDEYHFSFDYSSFSSNTERDREKNVYEILNKIYADMQTESNIRSAQIRARDGK